MLKTFGLAALATLAATPAFAADASPCPAGMVESAVRISKLVPGGTIDGIKAAVADHAAWYKAHDNPATIFAAPVLVMGTGGQMPTVSTTEIMTVRFGGNFVPSEKRDAAWKAYVAKYQANSTIMSETHVCFPAMK